VHRSHEREPPALLAMALVTLALVAVVVAEVVAEVVVEVSCVCLDGYCSTVQGLIDWFEVDLGFPELFVFRLICVLSVFLSPTLSSRSPLVAVVVAEVSRLLVHLRFLLLPANVCVCVFVCACVCVCVCVWVCARVKHQCGTKHIT